MRIVIPCIQVSILLNLEDSTTEQESMGGAGLGSRTDLKTLCKVNRKNREFALPDIYTI